MILLITLIVIAVIGGYIYFINRRLQQSRARNMAALPPHTDLLALASGQQRTLQYWAKLLEDLRRNEWVWPLVPAETKSNINKELNEFYERTFT